MVGPIHNGRAVFKCRQGRIANKILTILQENLSLMLIFYNAFFKKLMCDCVRYCDLGPKKMCLA